MASRFEISVNNRKDWGRMEYVTDTVDAEGRHYRVSVSARSCGSKGVVYVDAPRPEVLGGLEQPPVSTVGDDPENDKRWRAYNRQTVAIKRTFAEAVLPAACEALGVPHPGSLSFNRKAGCSCGCSPGFQGGRMGFNVWVTVEPRWDTKKAA